VMLADENPEMNARGPNAFGGSPVSLMVYVEDVDGVFGRALEAGAKEVRPVEDQFYGDRLGAFEDPFGHEWNVASHVEDVPPEEMEKRAAEAAQAG
jgi:PhnB protein